MISENIWLFTRTEEGYKIFPHDPNSTLPDNIKNELANLYTVEGISASYDGQATSLRFAPVQNYYMITVIFRNTWHPNHNRGHDCYVNFLYSPVETKLLFQGDFTKELKRCIARSKEITDSYGLQNTDISKLFLKNAKGTVSSVKFRAYAIALDRVAKKEQDSAVYIGVSKEESMEKTAIYLLELLPPLLRSKIGVYINAYSATETSKCNLVFLSDDELDSIRSSTSRGVMKNAVVISHNSFTWEIKRPRAEELFYIFAANNDDYKNITCLLSDCDDLNQFFEVISIYYMMRRKTLTPEEATVKIIDLVKKTTVCNAIINGYKLPDAIANIKKKKAYKKYGEIIDAVNQYERIQLEKAEEQKRLAAKNTKADSDEGAVGSAPAPSAKKQSGYNPKLISLLCDAEVFVSLLLKIIGVLFIVFFKKALPVTVCVYICVLIVLQYIDYLTAQVRCSLPTEDSQTPEDIQEQDNKN